MLEAGIDAVKVVTGLVAVAGAPETENIKNCLAVNWLTA
jgi:hypothetical protein